MSASGRLDEIAMPDFREKCVLAQRRKEYESLKSPLLYRLSYRLRCAVFSAFPAPAGLPS